MRLQRLRLESGKCFAIRWMLGCQGRWQVAAVRRLRLTVSNRCILAIPHERSLKQMLSESPLAAIVVNQESLLVLHACA